MGSWGPLKTKFLEGSQTKFAPLKPYTAPAEQTSSSAKILHWLPGPWGRVGCKLVEQLFPPPQGPESLICLENKTQSKSRSRADINETSVLSGKFSTRHFHSNTETVLAAEGRQSICAAPQFQLPGCPPSLAQHRMTFSVQTWAMSLPQWASLGSNILVEQLRCRAAFQTLEEPPPSSQKCFSRASQPQLSLRNPCYISLHSCTLWTPSKVASFWNAAFSSLAHKVTQRPFLLHQWPQGCCQPLDPACLPGKKGDGALPQVFILVMTVQTAGPERATN